MEKANKPLVSIITPLYNIENFISETIESVLSQTYTNFEMIIVDDSSINNRIKVIENNENIDVIKTRNRAIKIAKGKYISFLDSNDLWMKYLYKK